MNAAIVDQLNEFVGLGVEGIYLHHVGKQQQAFIDRVLASTGNDTAAPDDSPGATRSTLADDGR